MIIRPGEAMCYVRISKLYKSIDCEKRSKRNIRQINKSNLKAQKNVKTLQLFRNSIT